MKTALTIAGSDSSGGAGIQADIKTMAAHGIYAMSAITALTAQNTTGVYGIMEVSPEFLAAQLDCVFSDIFPDAVKIGMLPNGALSRAAAAALKKYGAKNVVVDPVMVATSGSALASREAIAIMEEELFPLADVITPNLPEAEALIGHAITDPQEVEAAAHAMHEKYGCGVLIKGGHAAGGANDCLVTKKGGVWIRGERIDMKNSHGTGCTLSSAIACELAAGCDLETAVRNAKTYLTGALAAGLDLGKGSGPVDHAYLTRKES